MCAVILRSGRNDDRINRMGFDRISRISRINRIDFLISSASLRLCAKILRAHFNFVQTDNYPSLRTLEL